MKNITLHKILMWLSVFFVGNSLFAQQAVDLTLKFNTTTSEYEVYARPTQNGTFSMGGGSQVSIITPASYPNTKLTVTSVEGGPWDDNSRLYDPIPAMAIDFHSISTNGTYPPFTFVANTEKLLFKFTATGGCVPGMRIYRNLPEGALPRDPDSNVAGMQGNDFENYLGQPSTGGNQEYNANYANTGITCGPAPVSDLITTIGQPATPFVAGSPSNVPVTVTNIGSAPDAGVITTTITLPTGFSAPATFPAPAGTTCNTNGQIVTCLTSGPLSQTAPNNTVAITVPVTPAASTVGVTPTPQTTATTGSPNEPATNTSNNPATPMSPTTPVAAAPAPDLITSIGQPLTPFVAGSPSNVPVTVTNVGSAPANGPITTTITLPTGFSAPTTFTTPAGTTCNTSGQIITCTTTGPLSQTAPNNTVAITVPVTPDASTVGVTPTPQTTATTGAPNEPATNTGNNPATPMSPTTPVAAAPAPDLITSIGQPLTPFVAGSPSNVPVTVTNVGSAPANGPITTTITLPTGFSAPTTFTTPAGTTCNTSGQIITCTTTGPLSQTAPNNTVAITVPVTPAASTVGVTPTPQTTATTGAPNEPATNTGNNPATPMSPTTPVAAAPAPDLITTIGTATPALIAGQSSNLPVNVTNIGTAPTTGVVTTTITLPSGVAPTNPTFTSNGFSCNTSGQVVTCTSSTPISNVSPANTAQIVVPVTPTAGIVGTTPVFNATTGGGGEPATNTGNNPAPATTSGTVTSLSAPDLITTIGTVSPTMVVGTTSNLPVTVTNIGTAPTTGTITTTITLPAGFTTPQSLFVTNGHTCSVNLQTVTCFSNNILTTTSPNNANVLQIPVTPSAVNVNTPPVFAATTGGGGEPAANTGNNPAPSGNAGTVSPAPAPNLTVAISQPSPSFVADQASTVTVTTSNIGTASATGPINTSITLPSGMTTTAAAIVAPAGTTCTLTGQTVNCVSADPLSSVSGSNTIVVNIPVTPLASTVNTTPVFNGNTSAASEPAANTGNNTATMTPSSNVAAAPVADLVTTIGQPAPALVAGTPSNVPVTVTNIGTAPTTGTITTIITLPAGTSATGPFTSNGNTCTVSGQTVTCTNPGPLTTTTPNNSTVINIPVTAAPSTIGQTPGPFTATPNTPGETNTSNNGATPMTPTISVTAPVVVNVKLNVKLFLQGAYDAATGLMRDDLRTRGFLPTAQPYSAMARTSYHTGTETTTAAVWATTGANAIVDWVLLELRTGTGVATRVATRAALVQRDGDVVDVDGISPVTFNNRAASAYYIVATHRNHLGVMSEVALTLSANPTTCDFTGAYDGFGNHAMKAIGNLNTLWAGNSNHTGITHRSLIFSGANNDPDAVKNDVLTAGGNSALDFSFVPTGYKLGDTNLDGDVKYQGPTNDVDAMIFFNVLSHPANTVTSPLYLVVEQH